MVERVLAFLDNNTKKFELHPFYYGHSGTMEKITSTKYKSYGRLEPFEERKKQYYRVSELPIGVWTDRFKEELEVLQEAKKIKGLKNYSTPEKIDFVFEPTTEMITVDFLKLYSYLYLSNMVLFTEADKIQKFDTVHVIFKEYFQKRLSLYEARIAHQIKKLQIDLDRLEQKALFIFHVVEKTLKIFDLQDAALEAKMVSLSLKKEEESFDYLLRIPIRDMTRSKHEALLAQIEHCKANLERLQRQTSSDLWREDLQKLQEAYYKIYS